jgi:hypothetical protein
MDKLTFHEGHYQKWQAFSPPFCCSISYSPPDPAWLSWLHWLLENEQGEYEIDHLPMAHANLWGN